MRSGNEDGMATLYRPVNLRGDGVDFLKMLA